MTAILLVDDDKIVLRSIRRVLRDKSHDLYIASSGEMAMSMLKCCEFALILINQEADCVSAKPLSPWLHHHYPATVQIMLGNRSAESNAALRPASPDAPRVLRPPILDTDLAHAVDEALCA